jgi:hypothetical protein
MVVSSVAGLPGESQYHSSVHTIIAHPPEPWLSQGDAEGIIDVGALSQAMQDTDVVIACDTAAPVAINTAVAFDVPCILWLSDSVAGRSLAETDAAMLDAIRYADRVVAESAYAASRFSQYLRPERALVASNTNSQSAPLEFVHAAGASGENGHDGEGRTDSADGLDALLDHIADMVVDAVRADRQFASTAQL